MAIYQAATSDNDTKYRVTLPCLPAFLVVVSVGMLRYWLGKKKILPVFDNLIDADIKTLT